MPALGQQRIQFPTPASSGLRPVGTLVQNTTGNTAPLGTSGGPVMVPLNSPSPSYTPSVPQFDPYSARQVTTPSFPQTNPFAGAGSVPPSLGAPSLGAPVGQPGTFGNPPNFGAPPSYGAPTFGGPPNFGAPLNSGYPGYNGASPSLPGAGQSGILGSSPYANNPSVYPPSAFPNSSPSALFPGVYPQGGYGYGAGGYGQSGLGSWFGNLFGNGGGAYGQPGYGQPGTLSPPGGLVLPPGGAYGNWNPQGSVFNGSPAYPQVLRLFQGPRFRHAWIYGSKDDDALEINDSDVALAFAIPNFMYSTQPVYILPSFSVHQWDGPRGGVADLPAIAYSAFVDAGWQSDPARIMGAELGGRVGWFSDFSANTTDSLRFIGRALGRVRLTPAATLKLGVIYLDRNKVKLLPAGGLLWQPNPETRFDLFFPEPKLAHYLATVGTMDTWWYVGGYYGGGSWTVKRASGAKESIDINDIRLLLGLEWGRNDQMRDGRRVGFLEVGYVFQRELLYKQSPADNLDLQDSIMVRAGFGY
ncbi:MAG: hypothetical protein SFV81_13540 [Pirellulaceae bacterium]|nr:hypothetical protein [Pirellulaceae bacterium]